MHAIYNTQGFQKRGVQYSTCFDMGVAVASPLESSQNNSRHPRGDHYILKKLHWCVEMHMGLVADSDP